MNVMIYSLKDFLIAVEKMRECQKEYFRTRTPSSLAAAKKYEAVVDVCIKKKRSEWADKLQLNFMQEA